MLISCDAFLDNSADGRGSQRRRLTIGPSVSSRCERSARRIRDERPEHGIPDASLEAAHRLLRDLPSASFFRWYAPPRGSLRAWQTAIMCMTWLRRRFPASESRCLTTSPLEASIGATPA